MAKVQKINRNRAILISLYGLILIVIGQVMVTYSYKTLNEKTDKFILAKIENEKIIRFDTLQYTPGKGIYTDIIISDDRHFPLFVEQTKDKKFIIQNSSISKEANSHIFHITNLHGSFEFKIYTPRTQQYYMRLLFLLATVGITLATFSSQGMDLITMAQNCVQHKVCCYGGGRK